MCKRVEINKEDSTQKTQKPFHQKKCYSNFLIKQMKSEAKKWSMVVLQSAFMLQF